MMKMARLIAGATAISTCVVAAGAIAQGVPIYQPGAPGKPDRVLTPQEAAKVADTRYIQADLDFMMAMIHHHQQAVDMAALVPTRTNNADLVALAAKISAGQKDEMRFMRSWLDARDAAMSNDMHMMHHMKGMATPEQLAALAAAKGTDFDRLFLQLMNAHHAGALDMAEDLMHESGSAYDPVLQQFITDLKNDQATEIKRMEALLARLVSDPRPGLKAGFRDAGEAIMGLEKVASLPTPQGFYDPANPASLPLPKAEKNAKPAKNIFAVPKKLDDETEWAERSPLLNFMQSDMAFGGNHLFVGNFHGFNIYQLDNNGIPTQVASVVCPGGQTDVSVVGNLLITSAEQNRGRVDCGAQGIDKDVSPDRFRGIRIYDISDITRPRQVGQVQTCRGSHTHSVVKGPEGDSKILVYVSGTGPVRKGEELAGCIAAASANSSYFRIDIVEIPVDNPAAARIVDSPAVFADLKTGDLAGLWTGGKHGDDTQSTAPTDQCHDITVYPARKIAAGACSGNGILLDISNPRKPKRIDAVLDPGFAYWHSATFNNDGTKVLYTDEWGGGGRPRCRLQDRRDWGADAIYDIIDNKLIRKGTYKLPAVQGATENCVAHNGSIVPVPGRDIMVQAWYQGGLSVVDFTDSANPREIAYFDRGPIDAVREAMGGYWSTYYYHGRIYGSEIARGLDVFTLKPSKDLTANEIAAAALADPGPIFNPQDQHPVTWPAVPVVARAYADNLRRAGRLDAGLDQRLGTALDAADGRLAGNAKDGALAGQLRQLARDTAAMSKGMSDVLDRIADRLS